MLATATAATLVGVDGHVVTVEVHVSNGLPSFTLVGLPDAACREARDRVRAAVLSSGLDWPDRRVTLNLAPSGLRKGGAVLDLAMAVAVLAVTEQLPGRVATRQSVLGRAGSRRCHPGRGGRCCRLSTRFVTGPSSSRPSRITLLSLRVLAMSTLFKRWASWRQCSRAARRGQIRRPIRPNRPQCQYLISVT